MAWDTNSTYPSTCDPCLLTFFDTYAVVLFLPCVLSLPLKGMVFWTQAFMPLTEKTDLLTINLFFNDFLLSVLAVISMSTIWVHPLVHMHTWTMLVSLLSIGHPLFHCFICVERFMAVEYPIVFLKYRPLRYRYAILTASWTAITLSTVILVVMCASFSAHLKVYLGFQCGFLFAIVNINSFCCLSILKTLIRSPPGDKTKRKREGHDLKRKAFNIVVMVQVNLLICYLPPICLFLSGTKAHSKEFCFILLFNIWYILLTSFFHSLLYMYSQGMLNIFKCFQKR